jgi:anti-anti-sigma factor
VPRDAGALLSVETVSLDHRRAHVRVTGDLDLSTGPAVWAILRSHLAAGRDYLRLDLSGVGFLDASALSGIAELHHAALARRGTLVLTGVSGRVARLLRLTGLDAVLLIGGPRADDDLGEPGPEPDPEPESAPPAAPTHWPAQPVPWTPPAVARGVNRPE